MYHLQFNDYTVEELIFCSQGKLYFDIVIIYMCVFIKYNAKIVFYKINHANFYMKTLSVTKSDQDELFKSETMS